MRLFDFTAFMLLLACSYEQEAVNSTLPGPLSVNTADSSSITTQGLPQPNDSIEVRWEYRFADQRIFEVHRYLHGQKHGLQLLYALNESPRPKFMELYDHGNRIWGMFPSADVDFTLSEGRFLKGVILHVDSAFIKAPFDSTRIWYEGSFIRVAGKTTPVGEHRIFDERGGLVIEVSYDDTCDSTSSNKRPLKITRLTQEH